MSDQMMRVRSDWGWLLAAWLLALVPSLVAVARLLQWRGVLPEPLPVASNSALALVLMLHLVSVLAFAVLTPWQLSPRSRQHNARWHRRLSPGLWMSGVLAALSGLVLSQFYPHGPDDGEALLILRWFAGVGMLAALLLGLRSARQRHWTQHGAWMIRAYAIGMGAGTQVLTHLPWLVWPLGMDETSRTLSMGAGWLINLAVAEVVIRRLGFHPRRHPESASSFRP